MMSNSDIFIIKGRQEDEYIIYAPIKGFVCLASGVAVNKVRESLIAGNWPDSLRKVGYALSQPDIFKPDDRFDLHSQFEPVGLMMELTTDCNLRW